MQKNLARTLATAFLAGGVAAGAAGLSAPAAGAAMFTPPQTRSREPRP